MSGGTTEGRGRGHSQLSAGVAQPVQRRWWTIGDSGSWRSPCCPCRARPFATALMTLASPCTRTTPPSTESSRVLTPPPCSRPGASCQSHSPERLLLAQRSSPASTSRAIGSRRRYSMAPEVRALSPPTPPLRSTRAPPWPTDQSPPPTDIEGHWGADGKLYLLDFSRLYPPESIQQTQALFPTNPMASRALFYKMLRPGTTHTHTHTRMRAKL